MFKILKDSKKIFVRIRSSFKFIFLLIIALILIIGLLSLLYKPVYGVTLDDEFIGYTSNKSKLQNKINEYMEKNEEQNIAFVDIELLPEYSLCLLKKDTQTNDDEIYGKVTDLGTVYYEYYAIIENNEEQNYVKTNLDAEEIINELKEKESSNIDNIAYTKIHSTELKEFSDTESVVTALYKEKSKVVTYASSSSSSSYNRTTIASTGSSSVLGISFIRPTSGTITSRFGTRGGHTGLDIAGSYGTTIYAAASGTVTYSGNNGSGYGNFIKISHGNGVETLYGHCSSLYVSAGEYVSQGESIAAMGSTGNSTGNHLHLEIRINGTAVNPQNYLY